MLGVAACRAELHGGAAALHDSLPAATAVSAAPTIPPDTAPHPARGFISLGPDVRTFRACGAVSDAWIADSTGDALWRVYGRLAAKTYDPLYVEVMGRWAPPPPDGFGAAYGRTFVITRLLRATNARGSAACDDPRPAGELRAHGTEPFWTLEIARGQIVFSRPADTAAIVFPYTAPRPRPGGRVYTARTEAAPHHTIRIDAREAPCIDAMSGEYDAATVVVTLDGRRYRGCGVMRDDGDGP
ncbi:MAG: hypothetical protein IRY91_06460 [Gemmatimonadaceae bacterium]|nr:hypothetical protein [Gemmatimonadaceae bacterium]